MSNKINSANISSNLKQNRKKEIVTQKSYLILILIFSMYYLNIRLPQFWWYKVCQTSDHNFEIIWVWRDYFSAKPIRWFSCTFFNCLKCAHFFFLLLENTYKTSLLDIWVQKWKRGVGQNDVIIWKLFNFKKSFTID